MATYYDKCQCGNKKAVLNATCRSCYIKTMKSLKRTKEPTYSSATTRICKACFCSFRSSVRGKYCNRCHNWGNKHGFGIVMLKHNFEVCDDQERKQKIFDALTAEETSNPVATAIANRNEVEIKELREAMTEIIRSDPFSSGVDKDGYPVFKTQKCGWRCKKCGRPQKKRCCRLCEMKIRGSI